jgi:hypothetical protein
MQRFTRGQVKQLWEQLSLKDGKFAGCLSIKKAIRKKSDSSFHIVNRLDYILSCPHVDNSLVDAILFQTSVNFIICNDSMRRVPNRLAFL